MAKSIRSNRKRQFRSVKRATLFGDVEAERTERLAKLQDATLARKHREFSGLTTAEEEKLPEEEGDAATKTGEESMQVDGDASSANHGLTRKERKRKYKKGSKQQPSNTLRGSKKFRSGQVKKTKRFVF